VSPGGGENVGNVRAGAGGARVEHDWFPGRIPANVALGRDVYVDTSYGFATFASERDPGLVLGDATGAYDRASFVVGPARPRDGRRLLGPQRAYVVCHDRVAIGSHALLAVGRRRHRHVALAAGGPGSAASLAARRAVLRAAAAHPRRLLPALGEPRPVRIEDNVWVGFDAVVLPGVTLGRGCVVAAKCVVADDVPPYAVVAGSPPRVVRTLDPTTAPRRAPRRSAGTAADDGRRVRRARAARAAPRSSSSATSSAAPSAAWRGTTCNTCWASRDSDTTCGSSRTATTTPRATTPPARSSTRTRSTASRSRRTRSRA
jgi:acetyltransferase-like isoleucine patch superfamily enzyme